MKSHEELLSRGWRQNADGSYTKTVRQSVVELVRAKSEPDRRRESQDRGLERRKAGVAWHILIVSYRTRRIDSHDNLRTAHKSLVDQITRTLGFASDDDPGLEWEYDQVIARGATGTQVLITLLERSP